MGAKGAVSILYRGDRDVQSKEKEYMDQFSNPFPAAVRGNFPLCLYSVFLKKKNLEKKSFFFFSRIKNIV